jgi:threonine synthase
MEAIDWETECTRCGNIEALRGFPYHCANCQGILLIQPADAMPPPASVARGIAAYSHLLPLAPHVPLVTLGEGGTPLVPAARLAAHVGLRALLLKNEAVNPTGSFKDRALALMVTTAQAEGYHQVISSSSGNAGASSAAYAAHAGLSATVIVPETTTRTKLAQILIHGATVIRVRGSTSDTYALARAATTGGWANLTTTFLSPLATAAFRTVGYELHNQLNGETPDWIVVPVSDGPLLVAIALAYRELQASGHVARIPRMVCAQAAGCAPIVAAFEAGVDAVTPWPGRPNTIATAIADPLRGYADDGTLTLRTVYETNGYAISVSDAATKQAIRDVARMEGVFAEPAGAVPVAALADLLSRSIIGPSDRVVCLITGHGLKDVAAAEQEVDLPVIDPVEEQLFEVLQAEAGDRRNMEAVHEAR